MDPESLYVQLGQLVAEMPNFGGTGRIPPEANQWLGRAASLVAVTGNVVDHASITAASNALTSSEGSYREYWAQTIRATVYRALADAEAKAPTAARGGFIGIGAALDALQVVGQVFASAKQDILVIDPYVDSKLFTDFGPTASVGLPLRVLTDIFYSKREAMLPSVTRWNQQFGTSRPLEVRLTAPRALHDRLILVDGTRAWTLTQSLKDFANRSPALVQRVDPDLSAMKRDFYEQLWGTSTPLT